MLFWPFFKKYRWEIVTFTGIDKEHAKILAYGFHIKENDALAIDIIGNTNYILGSQEQMPCYRFQVTQLTRSNKNPYCFCANLKLIENDFTDSDKFHLCYKKGRIWSIPFKTLCSAIVIAKQKQQNVAALEVQNTMKDFFSPSAFFNY